jgi:hypothetical protein
MDTRRALDTQRARDVKDIDYFMSLNYPFLMYKIPEEDGDGWLAEISDLPACGRQARLYF